MEPIFLSVRDTSRTLGLGRTKIYELISDGRLSTVKVGSRTLVRVSSIREIADSL